MAYVVPFDPLRKGSTVMDGVATHDEYFVEDRKDTFMLGWLEVIFERLEPLERDLITAHVFERKPYRVIAEEQGWETGGEPDKKKAWREVRKALMAYREHLTGREANDQIS